MTTTPTLATPDDDTKTQQTGPIAQHNTSMDTLSDFDAQTTGSTATTAKTTETELTESNLEFQAISQSWTTKEEEPTSDDSLLLCESPELTEEMLRPPDNPQVAIDRQIQNILICVHKAEDALLDSCHSIVSCLLTEIDRINGELLRSAYMPDTETKRSRDRLRQLNDVLLIVDQLGKCHMQLIYNDDPAVKQALLEAEQPFVSRPSSRQPVVSDGKRAVRRTTTTTATTSPTTTTTTATITSSTLASPEFKSSIYADELDQLDHEAFNQTMLRNVQDYGVCRVALQDYMQEIVVLCVSSASRYKQFHQGSAQDKRWINNLLKFQKDMTFHTGKHSDVFRSLGGRLMAVLTAAGLYDVAVASLLYENHLEEFESFGFHQDTQQLLENRSRLRQTARLIDSKTRRHNSTVASTTLFTPDNESVGATDARRIHHLVFTFLSPRDVLVCQLVCRDWYLAMCIRTPRLLRTASVAFEQQALFRVLQGREQKYAVPTTFLALQPHITGAMRAVLLNWIVEVQGQCDLSRETMHLTCKLIDRVLTVVPEVQIRRFQLIGTACILMATKMTECFSPEILTLITLGGNCCTRDQVLNMECYLLGVFQFKLCVPHSISFVGHIFQNCPLLIPDIRRTALFLCDMSLKSRTLATVLPSEIAVSAVLLGIYQHLRAESKAEQRTRKDLIHSVFSFYDNENVNRLAFVVSHLLFAACQQEPDHLFEQVTRSYLGPYAAQHGELVFTPTFPILDLLAQLKHQSQPGDSATFLTIKEIDDSF
jgi:hypothetical protein